MSLLISSTSLLSANVASGRELTSTLSFMFVRLFSIEAKSSSMTSSLFSLFPKKLTWINAESDSKPYFDPELNMSHSLEVDNSMSSFIFGKNNFWKKIFDKIFIKSL